MPSLGWFFHAGRFVDARLPAQPLEGGRPAEKSSTSLVSKILGDKEGSNGDSVEADKSHVTTGSILFDAIFVPGGSDSVDALIEQGDAKHFVAEAFKHKKPIGALGDGTEVLAEMEIPGTESAAGELSSEAGVVVTPPATIRGRSWTRSWRPSRSTVTGTETTRTYQRRADARRFPQAFDAGAHPSPADLREQA